MKMPENSKLLSLLLCSVLIAALALTAAGCGKSIPPLPELPKTESTDAEADASVPEEAEQAEGPAEAEPAPAEESSKAEDPVHFFTLKVVDADGNETVFNIETEKTVVGDALLEEGLIAGDDGPYGLYVKQVNGITADYDTDGTYWAFYVNGEMAMVGVDCTEIEDGAEYEFRVE